MEHHVIKATSLSLRLPKTGPGEGDDDFWALVKYAENVQECAVQLDNMKRGILEALEEVPLQADDGTELSWSGLKGMRSRLAHKFWDIDQAILWDTITQDFPVLQTLLSLVIVVDRLPDGKSVRFSFRAKRFRLLPVSDPKGRFTLGNSLIMLFFSNDGQAQCLRVAKESETRVNFKGPDDVTVLGLDVELVDGDEREHLASWPQR